MSVLTNDPNIEQKVVAAVQQRTQQSHNARVLFTQKRFLKGSLFTVAFDADPDPATGEAKSYINRVYVHGNSIDVYGHDEALLSIVGETHTANALEVFGNTKVVSGIIATLMTVIVLIIVSVGIYRGSSITIPDLVSNGWLLILGFYFGKMGSKED